MRRTFPSVALALALLAGLPAPANQWPMPPVAFGPRPGPDLLYAPASSAPQMSNGPGWSAAPLMVSGAEAYVAGEYLYQDYVYDSYGANTTDAPFAQPDPVPASSDVAFGGQTGDVAYPTDAARFRYNAADVLEFRARLDGQGRIVYRVTLNTMIDASAAAVAIGIDRAPGGADDWGSGIGSLGDLDLDDVIVAAGTYVSLAGASVSTDTATNQIEIATPLQPGASTWRHYLVAGLFDDATKTFKPVLENPTATHPGGAHGTAPPPVFNVGFRMALDDDEPAVRGDLTGIAADPAGQTGSRTVGAGNWREHGQALALAARDIARFSAAIDFGRIAAATTDTSRVPKSGFIVRLYASSLDLGEGMQPDRPMLLGKIQPYGLYVPTTYDGQTPAPFVLALHSLSCTYNQFAVFAPNLYRDLGEERGAFVLTTMGRGPDGWYHDAAEADLFEAWADVTRAYEIDMDRVAINGYSMGGYGTLRLSSQYPDLFNAAFGVVAPADENILGAPSGGAVDDHGTLDILANTRHVPMLLWFGTVDELVPLAGTLQVGNRLRELGYEHEADYFFGVDHFALSVLDEWDPGRAWITRPPVDRNPSRITYVAKPKMDNVAYGLVHDHAYWAEEIVVASGRETGLIDVRALPSAEPVMSPVLPPAGADPAPHVKSGLTPSGIAATPGDNVMELTLDGVTSVTLWPERGGIDGSRAFALRWSSSHAATVTLRGSFGTIVVAFPAGAGTATVN